MLNEGESVSLKHFATPWVVSELKECENFLDDSLRSNPDLPQVCAVNLQLREGGILGRGGFSTVYEAELEEADSRSRLAMKCLDPSRINSQDALAKAATNLGYEASILARLDHPNIIKLRGVSKRRLSSSFSTADGKDDKGYFLLLDVLDEILAQKLSQWTRESENVSTRMNSRKAKLKRSRRKTAVQERLQVSLEIAKAMEYLHSQDIVLRDLKPDNVGFDRNGTVKLFDLGMARPVEDCLGEKMIAGTFRYMAPENALGNCSGLPSDVYSFGILLWEMATLKRPYDMYFGNRKVALGVEDFREDVILGGWRHTVSEIGCPSLRALIQSCWAESPQDRPTFPEVVTTLTKIVDDPRHSSKAARLNVRQTVRLFLKM